MKIRNLFLKRICKQEWGIKMNVKVQIINHNKILFWSSKKKNQIFIKKAQKKN